MIFKGRLAISGPRKVGPNGELEKYVVGGALLTMAGQPVTKGGNWEMMECEVIIRPTKIHRTITESLKTARLDQVVQALSDDKSWFDAETPQKDIYDELMS